MVKGILIIFALLATANVLPAFGFNIETMMKLMLDNDLLRASNQPVKAKCFAAYSPKLAAIMQEYETQYANCFEASENATEIINQEVAANYTAVLDLNKEVCSRFTRCTQGTSNSYGFFECNNEGAPEAITMSNSIQSISKDIMEYMKMRNELVAYDLNACDANCLNKYKMDYQSVLVKLQYCLDGKTPAKIATVGPGAATSDDGVRKLLTQLN